MQRDVKEWSIKKIYENRESFIQAEYQRDPRLWKTRDKRLLIDSILKNIDIPKIYLNEIPGGQFEIIDGQQRLYAIWEFIVGDYKFDTDDNDLIKLKGKNFQEFPQAYKDELLNYKLHLTFFKDADDEYLRMLFVRLQLGLLLVAGEKLKAESGKLRDFIFNEMVKHSFIERINIPNRRYAKETLCAQICINSFKRAKIKSFWRTRYEDLYYFFSTDFRGAI